MLSQQDQEMRRNVPDPSFAGGSHLCGSGAGNETILCSDRTQQFKFDRAFGAIILAIKSSGVSSKSSSSSAKLKRLLLTVPVESGRRLAILGSDRTRQFKSDRASGAIILAIK